jgi:hypothetical protein
MAYGTINADQIGTSVANTSLGAGNASIMKNRIINGAMTINQRGYSATPTVDPTYTLDRWAFRLSQSSKFSVAQSSTAPIGFNNSLLVTSSSAYTCLTGDFFALYQNIEGFNTADLNWGSANAKTVTLSFQVYSSLTGTFGGVLANDDSSRTYPFSYTISSANTWTTISVTIAGDTTGTWQTTTSTGIGVRFSLGVGTTYGGTAGAWTASNKFGVTGQVNVVGTNGATFYITGVQLEVGSSATGFEYVNYQTSLNNCMRYFEQWNGGANYGCLPTGQIGNGNSFTFTILPLVFKRTTPSVTLSTTSGLSLFSAYGTNASGSTFPWSAALTVDTGMSGNLGVDIYTTLSGSGSGGAGTCVNLILRANQYIQISAEL